MRWRKTGSDENGILSRHFCPQCHDLIFRRPPGAFLSVMESMCRWRPRWAEFSPETRRTLDDHRDCLGRNIMVGNVPLYFVMALMGPYVLLGVVIGRRMRGRGQEKLVRSVRLLHLNWTPPKDHGDHSQGPQPKAMPLSLSRVS